MITVQFVCEYYRVAKLKFISGPYCFIVTVGAVVLCIILTCDNGSL